MNIQPNMHMGNAEFLDWVRSRQGRYELSGGRVVMTTGGSRGHAILVRRLAAALERRLDSRQWTVLTSDFGVDLGPGIVRYPDVVVDLAGRPFEDLTAAAPVLVAEVLSPSSAKLDLDDKPKEYFQLTTLSVYLVLAQDAPSAWVWPRGASGFPAKPIEVKGQESIDLVGLGLTLPLMEIYGGLTIR
jgi:Uma2 family endonuclease